MSRRALSVGVGCLVSSVLLAACNQLPWRSSNNKSTPSSEQSENVVVVQRGTSDGAPWELRARKTEQVCAELVQLRPRRTVSRVCPQGQQDAGANPALRYALGSLTATKRHAFVVVVSGVTDVQATKVAVEFASGQSVDTAPKQGSGFAIDRRYFAIPLEDIPEGGIKAISATNDSGQTLARFELGPGGVSQSPSAASPGTGSVSPGATSPSPRATATSQPGAAGNPPWSAPPIPQSETPRVLMVAWEKAQNRLTCSPLAPQSLGEGEDAKPRRANFSGGWGVAYDKAGLPGRARSGEPCEDCGRGVFGLAGTGAKIKGPEELDPDNVLPLERRWSDGSRADYGPEGGQGPNFLATLYVKDEECVYNVWSFIGQAHLEHLLDNLRFIQAGRS